MADSDDTAPSSSALHRPKSQDLGNADGLAVAADWKKRGIFCLAVHRLAIDAAKRMNKRSISAQPGARALHVQRNRRLALSACRGPSMGNFAKRIRLTRTVETSRRRPSGRFSFAPTAAPQIGYSDGQNAQRPSVPRL